MTTATSALLLTVVVTFINGCSAYSLLLSSPSSFHVGIIARRNNRNNEVRPMRPRDGETALSMGIRSFIKRKFLGNNSELDDEDNDEYNSDEERDVTLRSIISSFSSTSYFTDEISSTDNIPGKKSNIDRDGLCEDTNERIRRIKTGGMTEEEKARFLNTALTGALPKQKPRGPPIRQTIPPGMAADEGGYSRSSDRSQALSTSSTSSSAKDNLWQAITTKKDGNGGQIEKGGNSGSGGRSSKDISVVSLMMDEKSKGEEAKRKYLASITNPDRFNTFSTYNKKQQPSDIEGIDNEDENILEQPPSKDECEIVESSDFTSGSDFAEMKRQIAEDRALLNPLTDKPESAARVAVESILNMINSNNDKKTESVGTFIYSDASQSSKSTTNDLAARLGQAAEEQEKRDAEARIALDRKREEQKQQLLEIQMRREEEARMKEMERVEKVRRVAQEDYRKKSENENAEKVAMAARQAMQDEYWQRMLEKERVRKGGTKEPFEIKEKGGVVRDSQLKTEQNDEVREDPLDNNKTELVPNVETILLAAARVSRPVPRRVKDEITESPFVREQRLKKEEVDRLRQVDMQSLKSLNSPIPSLSKASPATYRAPPMPAPIREAQAQANPVSSSPPSPSQQQKQKQPLNTPAKRIVRQQAIIREDDDDDDDETFSRSSAPGLTVADALKNRRRDDDGGRTESDKIGLSAEDKAKQWGIDMSRFN